MFLKVTTGYFAHMLQKAETTIITKVTPAQHLVVLDLDDLSIAIPVDREMYKTPQELTAAFQQLVLKINKPIKIVFKENRFFIDTTPKETHENLSQ